jgi:hypothetical protein
VQCGSKIDLDGLALVQGHPCCVVVAKQYATKAAKYERKNEKILSLGLIAIEHRDS